MPKKAVKKTEKKKKDPAPKVVDGSKVLKNKRHELFCQLYSGLTSQIFFNNATRSYLYVYGGQERINEIEDSIIIAAPKRGVVLENEADELPVLPRKLDIEEGKTTWRQVEQALRLDRRGVYNVANVEGSRLLVNPSILARCNYLLDRYTDPELADREMAWVIAQRHDIRSKVAAYEAVNKAKGRLSDRMPNKLVITWDDAGDDSEEPEKKEKQQGAKKTGNPGKKSVSVSFEGDDTPDI